MAQMDSPKIGKRCSFSGLVGAGLGRSWSGDDVDRERTGVWVLLC